MRLLRTVSIYELASLPLSLFVFLVGLIFENLNGACPEKCRRLTSATDIHRPLL
jgi:hypothetical protein